MPNIVSIRRELPEPQLSTSSWRHRGHLVAMTSPWKSKTVNVSHETHSHKAVISLNDESFAFLPTLISWSVMPMFRFDPTWIAGVASWRHRRPWKYDVIMNNEDRHSIRIRLKNKHYKFRFESTRLAWASGIYKIMTSSPPSLKFDVTLSFRFDPTRIAESLVKYDHDVCGISSDCEISPPSWKYDVVMKIKDRQSIRIWSRNKHAEFRFDSTWNAGALGMGINMIMTSSPSSWHLGSMTS